MSDQVAEDLLDVGKQREKKGLGGHEIQVRMKILAGVDAWLRKSLSTSDSWNAIPDQEKELVEKVCFSLQRSDGAVEEVRMRGTDKQDLMTSPEALAALKGLVGEEELNRDVRWNKDDTRLQKELMLVINNAFHAIKGKLRMPIADYGGFDKYKSRVLASLANSWMWVESVAEVERLSGERIVDLMVQEFGQMKEVSGVKLEVDLPDEMKGVEVRVGPNLVLAVAENMASNFGKLWTKSGQEADKRVGIFVRKIETVIPGTAYLGLFVRDWGSGFDQEIFPQATTVGATDFKIPPLSDYFVRGRTRWKESTGDGIGMSYVAEGLTSVGGQICINNWSEKDNEVCGGQQLLVLPIVD